MMPLHQGRAGSRSRAAKSLFAVPLVLLCVLFGSLFTAGFVAVQRSCMSAPAVSGSEAQSTDIGVQIHEAPDFAAHDLLTDEEMKMLIKSRVAEIQEQWKNWQVQQKVEIRKQAEENKLEAAKRWQKEHQQERVRD